MTYEIASRFAQTWGLLFLVVAFLLALAYALWPGNRAKFRRAAQLPLSDEPPPAGGPSHNDPTARTERGEQA